MTSVRLWTVHPRYLDSAGLVALWREALLARMVLRKRTTGYRNHPQLRRFQQQRNPVACINSYLASVYEEASRRGFRFDRSKLGRARVSGTLPETSGQLAYEWRHLMRKLDARSPSSARKYSSVRRPAPHPLFRIVPGGVREWERARESDA